MKEKSRNLSGLLAAAVIAALVAALGPGCGGEPGEPAPQEKDWASLVDEKRAWADLVEFANIGGMNHAEGSRDGLRRARDLIKKKLEEAGLKVQLQLFKDDVPGRKEKENFRNIIGVIEGKRKEGIAFGCHYDTKIIPGAEQFVGANDGCSGVSLLIELARQFQERANREQPEFSLFFTFFDGEEAFVDWRTPNKGKPDNTYGSRFMAAPPGARKKFPIECLILIDMIGDRDLRLEHDQNSHPSLMRMFSAESREFFGIDLFGRSNRIEDDHIAFKNAGMTRVIDLIDLDYGPANSWWHTEQDTVDKCSERSLAKVGSLVLRTYQKVVEWLKVELEK